MLKDTVFLIETTEENGSIKKYKRIDGSEEEFKINEESSVESIREYMDVLQNNAEKYF